MPFIGIGVGVGRQRFASGGFVGLLDTYSGAAAAYSLRKLRAAYTGSAIEVRRTNNDVADIGFTSTGELDTAALLAFTGTGALDNGFITTWYDQSGNGNNATQTTALAQPQIVSSGSIINVNSKPCIQFTSTLTTNLALTSSIWTYTGNSTLFHTSRNRNTGASEYGSIISQGGGTSNSALGIQWQQFPNAATQASTDVYAPGGMSTSGTQSVNVQYLATFQWQNWSTHKTNGNTIIAINGANQTLTAYGANPSTLTLIAPRIGTFDNISAGSFLGDIQEIVIYTTVLSQPDIDGAEDNINDFYNIY
jgi:hypothetical protein